MYDKIQLLVEKMLLRINDEKVTTKKLSEIIQIAVSVRDNFIEVKEDEVLPEDWLEFKKLIKDLTEVIVRANYKAQQILNPRVKMPSLKKQLKEAFSGLK